MPSDLRRLGTLIDVVTVKTRIMCIGVTCRMEAVCGTPNVQPSDVTCHLVVVRGTAMWECYVWVSRTDAAKV